MGNENISTINDPANVTTIPAINNVTNSAGAQIDNLGKPVNNMDNQAMAVPNDEDTEDTTLDTYRAMIAEKDDLIKTLLEQTATYQKQIGQLIRNGAVINDGKDNEPPAQPGNVIDPTAREDYVSLAELGNQIGK